MGKEFCTPPFPHELQLWYLFFIILGRHFRLIIVLVICVVFSCLTLVCCWCFSSLAHLWPFLSTFVFCHCCPFVLPFFLFTLLLSLFIPLWLLSHLFGSCCPLSLLCLSFVHCPSCFSLSLHPCPLLSFSLLHSCPLLPLFLVGVLLILCYPVQFFILCLFLSFVISELLSSVVSDIVFLGCLVLFSFVIWYQYCLSSLLLTLVTVLALCHCSCPLLSLGALCHKWCHFCCSCPL